MVTSTAPGVASGGVASGVVPGVIGDAPRAHAIGAGYRGGGGGSAGPELESGVVVVDSIGQVLSCLLSTGSVVPPRLRLEQERFTKQKAVYGSKGRGAMRLVKQKAGIELCY